MIKEKKKNLGGPLVVGARFINTALVAQAVWGPSLPVSAALDTGIVMDRLMRLFRRTFALITV